MDVDSEVSPGRIAELRQRIVRARWRGAWPVAVLLAIAVVIYVLANLFLARTVRHYQGTQLGVTFDFPGTWHVEEDDRVVNRLYVEPQWWLFQRGSCRVEMLENPPSAEDTREASSSDEVGQWWEDRQDMELVKIVQPRTSVTDGEYEITSSSVMLRRRITRPLWDPRFWLGEREVWISQTVVSRFILDKQSLWSVSARVFLGENAELDLQAEAIAESVKIAR